MRMVCRLFLWKSGALLFAVISCGFILGGLFIANSAWAKIRFSRCSPPTSSFGSSRRLYHSTVHCLLAVGMFIYISVVPFIEAAEHTILQKVVPLERQGRVFGFAQSVEQSAAPLTTFLIGPIAELFSSRL
jgi:MFS transporter, DHA3 family, multidrug efflux protein